MRSKDPVIFDRTCPWCGRRWQAQTQDGQKEQNPAGSWLGFMHAPTETHIYRCRLKTPVERRAANAKDERRWAQRPPRAKITNMVDHPGLRGEQDPPIDWAAQSAFEAQVQIGDRVAFRSTDAGGYGEGIGRVAEIREYWFVVEIEHPTGTYQKWLPRVGRLGPQGYYVGNWHWSPWNRVLLLPEAAA